jgi:hypothetical protein
MPGCRLQGALMAAALLLLMLACRGIQCDWPHGCVVVVV